MHGGGCDAGGGAAGRSSAYGGNHRGGQRHEVSGREFVIKSKTLVNACGPCADALNGQSGVTTEHRHLFSKGIHLITRRITESKRVLTFFADDGRMFFVIPMGNKSCIGTTDTRVEHVPAEITDEDRQFVLENINKRLQLPEPLSAADIIAERCGVRPLVVKAGSSGGKGDWTSLSRKHEIDVDAGQAQVTIYGGKLTDCLNVGEEVAKAVERLGLPLEKDRHNWYGEPAAATREEFFRRARLMRLDDLRERPDVEPLSERLWRRYGRRAFQMLDLIEQDPSMGVDVMDNADYLRVELHMAARTEMVTKLEDFMRRRSKIDLVVRDSEIRASEGLVDVAQILFSDRAQEKLDEYLAIPPVS